jgi:hypothetical protein
MPDDKEITMPKHECKCGENNPDKFYGNSPYRCRACCTKSNRESNLRYCLKKNRETRGRKNRNCIEFKNMSFLSKGGFKRFCQRRRMITNSNREWASKINVPSCDGCNLQKMVDNGFLPINARILEV